MNIYVLVAKEMGGRDVFDGFVIIARTSKDARKIAYTYSYGDEGKETRTDSKQSIITCIGKANTSQKEGISLASFCAA